MFKLLYIISIMEAGEGNTPEGVMTKTTENASKEQVVDKHELNVKWKTIRFCTHCHNDSLTGGGCPNCGEPEIGVIDTKRIVPQTNTLVDPFLRRINSREIRAAFISKDSPNPNYEIDFRFADQAPEIAEAFQQVTMSIEVLPDDRNLQGESKARITDLRWTDAEGTRVLADVVDPELKLTYRFKSINEVRGQLYASDNTGELSVGSFEGPEELLAVFHENGHITRAKELTPHELRRYKAARVMTCTSFVPKEIQDITALAEWSEKNLDIPRSEFEGIELTRPEASEIVIAEEEKAWEHGKVKLDQLYVGSSSGLKAVVDGVYNTDRTRALATYYSLRQK